ncbi:MAG: hypothetical protein EOO27_45780, partial [Comamonadaceae bacterium]
GGRECLASRRRVGITQHERAVERHRARLVERDVHVDHAARRKALSATKIEIDRTGRLVGQEAVQMHGGMGVTEELAIGHYFKRLSMIGVSFGDTDFHLRRYAEAA